MEKGCQANTLNLPSLDDEDELIIRHQMSFDHELDVFEQDQQSKREEMSQEIAYLKQRLEEATFESPSGKEIETQLELQLKLNSDLTHAFEHQEKELASKIETLKV